MEQINKYVNEEYNEIYTSAKVAQDIILSYLFKSEYKNNVTIKGGVVMYNLTNDKRRATIDIDLDLIKIYLADDNLYKKIECILYEEHGMVKEQIGSYTYEKDSSYF